MGSLSGFISDEKSDLAVFRKTVTSQGSTLTKSARRYRSSCLTDSLLRHEVSTSCTVVASAPRLGCHLLLRWRGELRRSLPIRCRPAAPWLLQRGVWPLRCAAKSPPGCAQLQHEPSCNTTSLLQHAPPCVNTTPLATSVGAGRCSQSLRTSHLRSAIPPNKSPKCPKRSCPFLP